MKNAALHPTLSYIRLELARTPEFPQGSPEHSYEFAAPLTKDGFIDAAAWTVVKDRCQVTRSWGSAPVQTGRLRHVGRGWRFDYDPAESSDDEPFFKLDKHAFRPGAYVSLTEQDGIERPFRIASVAPLRS